MQAWLGDSGLNGMVDMVVWIEWQGDGSSITVEPGLIGGEVNRILAAHKNKHGHSIQYKIGPDPSSIDSCMIGGIVNNNSSGMCCGVSQNTYHTLQDMRMVFADGTVLDTADPQSRQNFLEVCHTVGHFSPVRQRMCVQMSCIINSFSRLSRGD